MLPRLVLNLNCTKSFAYKFQSCRHSTLKRHCSGSTKSFHHNKPLKNSEKEQKIQKLFEEVELYNFQAKCDVNPERISTSHWENILCLQTKSARLKYYQYLTTVQKIKESKRLKKTLQGETVNQGTFDPFKKLFLQISDQSIAHHRNTRLIQAMRFGQKLVVDCSYDEEMSLKEVMSTAKQLTRIFGHNRLSLDPFDIHLCNIQLDSPLMKHLQVCIPTVLDKTFPLNIHEDSYLNHFPKESLVYLTPHCNNELLTVDPNRIYIIGALTDKVKQKSLSVLKAERDGLQMAKFPLDTYLKCKRSFYRALPIDQVLRILLEVKESGSWVKALQHLPTRKFLIKETDK